MKLERLPPRTIGERLRIERLRLRFSAKALSAVGRIVPKTQSNYEQNKSSPTAAYLSLVGAVGVDIAWVLTGSTPQPRVHWDVVSTILVLFDRWAAEQPEMPTQAARYESLRELYLLSHECGQVDPTEAVATFRRMEFAL